MIFYFYFAFIPGNIKIGDISDVTHMSNQISHIYSLTSAIMNDMTFGGSCLSYKGKGQRSFDELC